MVEHCFRKAGVVGSSPVFGFVNLQEKYNSLIKIVKSLGKVALAYSGGVDSTFLLKVLIDTLGKESVLACLCVSELLTPIKHRQAIEQAGQANATLAELQFDILTDHAFTSNPPDKCYICKTKIYGLIAKTAKERGFDSIVSGTNFDDLDDYRPGNKAAEEFGVTNPLAQARLTKPDIRQLSRKMNLPTADTPSSPCLASRVPYGQIITKEKLMQTGQAEDFLKSLGFVNLRVRHHDTLAKIEVPPSDFAKITEQNIREQIIEKFKSIGFKYISLDLQGFRSGSLNETLTQ